MQFSLTPLPTGTRWFAFVDGTQTAQTRRRRDARASDDDVAQAPRIERGIGITVSLTDTGD